MVLLHGAGEEGLDGTGLGAGLRVELAVFHPGGEGGQAIQVAADLGMVCVQLGEFGGRGRGLGFHRGLLDDGCFLYTPPDGRRGRFRGNV